MKREDRWASADKREEASLKEERMNTVMIFRKIMGILLTIIGAICLTYSSKSKSRFSGDPLMEDCVKRTIKDGGFVPSMGYRDTKLLIIGFACVVLGAIMTW
jgi:hypothetical protein